MPGNETMAQKIAANINAELAEFTLRRFPDGETYLRITSDLLGKNCVFVCSLNQPDDKILALYYLSKLCRELGADKVTLISPYLSYMRQDTRFHEGEAITSEYFAQLLSKWFDELITVDPHLHRKHNMSELYSIPCKVLHSPPVIADWIKNNIKNPLLIGPDSESEQWVSDTARYIDAPYIILEKNRLGDKSVEISVPNVSKFVGRTPVLVDDIISTARTMIETVYHLIKAQMQPPVIIGVHAVFSGDAFQNLKDSGVSEIITCNTIPHITNRIDFSKEISKNL